MARVLLVEDEDTLRDSVASYLEFQGHQVLAAATGREAFDLGVSGRPDVLVADWMLRNHIHGLHVAQTLRAIDPSLHTVLITGFPSRDLEAEFEASGVLQMLEKPFDLSDLDRAIRRATEEGGEGPLPGAAVIEVDADGTITFASPGARALFAGATGSEQAVHLEDVCGPGWREALEAAQRRWAPIGPRAGDPGAWLARARVRHNAPGWLVVLCSEDDPRWINDPRVRVLLDHHSRSGPIVNDLGPVIVLERDSAVRRLLASQIERIGGLCYLAEDLESALRLLAAEPRVAAVLVDLETAGERLDEWLQALREARPAVRVVGTGGSGDVSGLLARGLSALLEKPWRIDELADVLREGRG